MKKTLIISLLLTGCAIRFPPKDCCYGERIPDGYRCKVQEVDCMSKECWHYRGCEELVKEGL